METETLCVCASCGAEVPWVQLPMTDKKKPSKRGRPQGSTQWGEPKVNKNHRMTPTAHEWIRSNKYFIEQKAREPCGNSN